MKRLSILTIQFYLLIFWYNIACTVAAQVLVLFGGMPINTGSFLIAKILGYLGAIGLDHYTSKNHYYYFRNTGYSMRWVFIGAFATDIIVYLFIVLICLNSL